MLMIEDIYMTEIHISTKRISFLIRCFNGLLFVNHLHVDYQFAFTFIRYRKRLWSNCQSIINERILEHIFERILERTLKQMLEQLMKNLLYLQSDCPFKILPQHVSCQVKCSISCNGTRHLFYDTSLFHFARIQFVKHRVNNCFRCWCSSLIDHCSKVRDMF